MEASNTGLSASHACVPLGINKIIHRMPCAWQKSGIESMVNVFIFSTFSEKLITCSLELRIPLQGRKFKKVPKSAQGKLSTSHLCALPTRIHRQKLSPESQAPPGGN